MGTEFTGGTTLDSTTDIDVSGVIVENLTIGSSNGAVIQKSTGDYSIAIDSP